MTGGGAFVTAPREEYDLGASASDHSVQWVGTPGVKGPPWARLPLLTVGMLGTQVVWSVEMGYGMLSLLSRTLS
jgi:solute carrier family 45 protein 1/2/4